MKICSQIIFGYFLIFTSFVVAQNSYNEIWFQSHCDYCKKHPNSTNKMVLNSKESTDWHNAHVSLTNRNFKASQKYILNDEVSNDTIRQLFENHLLYRLQVEDQSVAYLRSLQNVSDKNIRQFVYKNLGNHFLKKQQKDSAHDYFTKALAIPVAQSYQFKNEIAENQAYIYVSEEKYKKAEQSYRQILASSKAQKDSFQIAKTYSNLGNLYFEQYNDTMAKQYFDSAYNFAKPLKISESKSVIAYNMYLISEILKDHEKAIYYLKEHAAINDSLQKQNALWQMAAEKEDFNIARKQAEIDLKTAERNTFFVIAIAIMLLLLIGIVFYKKLSRQHQKKKKLNTELKETNAVKNQLFTIIAHDLRSPVARLKQLFQLRSLKKQSPGITSDKHMQQITNSLSFLLDNLLNWALSQSKLLSVQKEWFPVWQIVRQTVAQYQPLITEKQLLFTVNVDKSILVFGDMEILKLVLRNSLDNAVKFTPRGGNIEISGEVKKENYKISVTDSGVGISSEALKTIFDVRVNKSKKDTSGRKSSGLGLSLTKQMMQQNGGDIRIQQNPKGGTIVTISLPYKNAA